MAGSIKAEFENLYSILEDSIGRSYGDVMDESPVYWFESNLLEGEDRSRLKQIRELRNLYSHNPDFTPTSHVAIPTRETIVFLEELIDRVENYQRAEDVMVLYDQVEKRGAFDPVLETVRVMEEKNFAFIPILRTDRRVEGIFSEHTVFRILARNGVAAFSHTLNFSQLGSLIALDNPEVSCRLRFVDRFESVYSLCRLASENSRTGRIDLFLVTENSREDGPLMGIITPWDLIRA